MALYDRFFQFESCPNPLLRLAVYRFLLLNFLVALNTSVLGLSSIFDISTLIVATDTNANLVDPFLIMRFWTFIALFGRPLLLGVGALSFLKIAFDEDLLIWLRMISLIAVIALVFGSFIF